MARRRLTEDQVQRVREAFPNMRTADLAAELGRGYSTVADLAHRLGLKKSPAFLQSLSARFKPGHQPAEHTQFKPGLVPWNKGTKGQCGHHQNSQAHHFGRGVLSGRAAQLAMPLGAYRVNSDGVLEQKIGTTPGAPHLRWKPAHRLVWERAHGPVPAGFFVVFKPGCRTTDLAAVTTDKLEVVNRAENMRRNSIHTRVPEELKPVVRLRAVLSRVINHRARQQQGAATPKEPQP